MTSPELIRELQSSRPSAPDALRARVRELAAGDARPVRRHWPRLALPRPLFVLAPAATGLVLAIGIAGIVGLTDAGNGDSASTSKERSLTTPAELSPLAVHGEADTTTTPKNALTSPEALNRGFGAATAPTPTPGRAQRVDATLSVRVADSDHVARAAQEALDLTRSLGGHVLTADVTTGSGATANLTVRIPVAKTQEAITRLSALGKIVSQNVSIEDLQERLDALTRRARSVRAQIVKITARLESEALDAETRASLVLRRRTLRTELRNLRASTASTTSEARFATIQLSVVTPDSEGVVPTPSRLHRSLDKAVTVLVWEGIVALVVLLVAAPLAIVGLATWALHRVYRRHEEDRLLAAS
jgi:hypothetical protein